MVLMMKPHRRSSDLLEPYRCACHSLCLGSDHVEVDGGSWDLAHTVLWDVAHEVMRDLAHAVLRDLAHEELRDLAHE